MKKVSTAGVKQAKNFSEQKLTIGLDLGDRSSWYCVLNEAGEVVLEQRLSTTPKAMKEVFGGMPRSRTALETGMHSPWVSRVLSELGHEVIVAHARNVRLIGESRKKDDRLDARTLARLARIDPQLLAPVQHRSAQAQAHLMVIRARAGLVRARTSLINTARGLTKSYGERLQRESVGAQNCVRGGMGCFEDQSDLPASPVSTISRDSRQQTRHHCGGEHHPDDRLPYAEGRNHVPRIGRQLLQQTQPPANYQTTGKASADSRPQNDSRANTVSIPVERLTTGISREAIALKAPLDHVMKILYST
jgi:transposase